MATLNLQVGASGDDGCATHIDEFLVIAGNNLYMGVGDGVPTNDFGAFARFAVSIPPGSTISSAYLVFTASNSDTADTVRLKIYANDADNPAAPSTYAQFMGVTKTSAQLDWDFTTNWAKDSEYASPNIASIIQELVSRPGWQQNNHVVLFCDNDNTGTYINLWRIAYTYDNNPSKAVKLEITYTAPAACYALTRAHTGSGSDPTAAPTYSDGCVLGSYHAGEVITMTARPAAGWYLASWTGTDGAQSNILTMPAAARTVTANYLEIPEECYALTRAHTGSGSDPTALPTSSDGCGAGEYTAGEVITMTALPAAGYELDSWTGTDGAQSNILTMPAAARTVTANYVAIPRPWGAPMFF